MNNEVKVLKAQMKKAHTEALPFLMFMLGLIASAFLSEFIAILHEIIKDKGGMNYEVYRLTVLVVSPFFLTYISWFIYRDFIRPLDRIDKKIRAFEKRR